MNSLINKTNGKVNVFTTIHSFRKIQRKEIENFILELCDYNTAIVDCVLFDFANEKCYENVIKMHEWLENEKIIHRINFSGRKFHLYVYVYNDEKCKFLKDAIYNIQVYLCNKLKFSYGEEKHEQQNNPDIDSRLIGNLAGLTRIPNTYNPVGQRYCVPLNKTLLYSGFEHIKEIAKNQVNLNGLWFGKIRMDLTLFDDKRKDLLTENNGETIHIPILQNDEDFGNEKFYPCIKKCLVDRSGYSAWFIGALWLREKGFSYKEADEIFKKYLSKFTRTDGYQNDYVHAKYSDKTLETVYKDKEQKYKVPRCETMWQIGLCPGKCKHFNDLYFMRKNVQRTTETVPT